MRHFETIIKLLLALMLTLMFFASAMNYKTGDSLYIVISIICVILSYGIFLSKSQHK